MCLFLPTRESRGRGLGPLLLPPGREDQENKQESTYHKSHGEPSLRRLTPPPGPPPARRRLGCPEPGRRGSLEVSDGQPVLRVPTARGLDLGTSPPWDRIRCEPPRRRVPSPPDIRGLSYCCRHCHTDGRPHGRKGRVVPAVGRDGVVVPRALRAGAVSDSEATVRDTYSEFRRSLKKNNLRRT